MIDFSIKDEKKSPSAIACIKVIGVGGAGGNTINCMVEQCLDDIEFIAANTDAQALELSRAPVTLQLGAKLTKGLGSGSNPEVGKRAAEEDLEKINECIQDADIVFITGGLGGGTGSGGLPVVAQQLKDNNVLSIAVVTKPFAFEGKRRMRIAEDALAKLKKEVDTIIVIPNEKLLTVADDQMSLLDAFTMVNEVIAQFVRSISNIITHPGHINVDFADVKSIMKNMGVAVMGTGRASGKNRAQEATLQAISSPLLEEHSIKGARGILLNITGNRHIGLHEVSTAASLLYEQADEDANIVLGSVIDESLGDEIMVTIIATGFESRAHKEAGLQKRDVESIQVQPTVRDSSHDEIATAPAPGIVPAPTPQVVVPVQEEAAVVNADMLNDLEIPAVLRRMMQEQQRAQQSNE